LNFKRIIHLLTVILGLTVLYSGFKIMNLDLYPWLNVFIASVLSLTSFILNYFVKGKSIVLQLLLLSFFIVQLFLNYIILQNPEVLISSWRWLFYPVSIFVFILSVSALLKKKYKLVTLSLILASFLFFMTSIFSTNPIWLQLQILFFILFSIGLVASKKYLEA
jgi:hypothetical protein